MEPKLQLHKVVPLFTLRDKHGQEHNLAKQRGREHLLLIVFGPDAHPQSLVQTLASQAGAWRQIPARGIAVVPDAETAGALGATPFTVLIDEAGRVQQRFLPPEATTGVFALDRYGALYHQWLLNNDSELPAADEITGWLEAISMQCSI
jgi:peroxiredoxin